MIRPRDQYKLNDFEQWYSTVTKAKPGLQRVFEHLVLDCLNLLNHAIDQRRRARMRKPTSPLKAIKLHYLLPAPIFSTSG